MIVTLLAGLAYAWGFNDAYVEPFYGAAARSMTLSWHNFFFGAADPWGTVSVDKLPGALWIQALSLKAFGFHIWALVLPQVMEGMLAVLVLYRAVRRVAGAGAGIIAAIVMAGTPIVILLDRGNIADSLLILLLVLAADACTRALLTGSAVSLVWAGVLVGLAFQAKMLQAWIALPAIYVAYLVASPVASWARRSAHIVLSGAVTLIVSLSWMSVVTLFPPSQRPYVDGSCNDSVFAQVFSYNGVARLGSSILSHGCTKPSAYLVTLQRLAGQSGVTTAGFGPSWDRLLHGPFGHDDAWMLLPAVFSAGAVLILRRHEPRTDARRASVILWSSWLVLTYVLFSAAQVINSYYVAALIPAVAALCGIGAAEAWDRRRARLTRVMLLTLVLTASLVTIVLVPSNTGLRDLILGTALVTEVFAIGILMGSLRSGHDSSWNVSLGFAAAAVALLAGSFWASSLVVSEKLGPFDSPYAPAFLNAYTQTTAANFPAFEERLKKSLLAVPSNRAAEVFETSRVTGPYILASGREFLPVGGFSGQVPAPSLTQFKRYVSEGRITTVTVATQPLTHARDLKWVASHCRPGERYAVPIEGAIFTVFTCVPGDA